jgi:hypothetical protein
MAGSGFESTVRLLKVHNVDTYFQAKQRAGDRDTRRVYHFDSILRGLIQNITYITV